MITIIILLWRPVRYGKCGLSHFGGNVTLGLYQHNAELPVFKFKTESHSENMYVKSRPAWTGKVAGSILLCNIVARNAWYVCRISASPCELCGTADWRLVGYVRQRAAAIRGRSCRVPAASPTTAVASLTTTYDDVRRPATDRHDVDRAAS